MNVMNDIILNLILMMFPILIYFMYSCYKEVCMEKYNDTLLGVALISSMYLCFKFGNVDHNRFVLLFYNLPIVVAYLKRQIGVAVLLSFCIIFYVYSIIHVYVIIFVIQYFCYFIIHVIGKKRKIKDNTFIMSIVVIQGFFVSYGYFQMINDNEVISALKIIGVLLVFYILPFILLYLFQMADQVTNLYFTVSELQKEKQLKNSLFKITHEVKNPIAVCKGYLDMLNVNDIHQVSRYIPIVKGEIARSLDIMNDFMEFSKIKIDKDIIDVNMLLEDINDEFKILMNHKNISMDFHIINEEIYIEGDYNRLKQVFVNLIKNSLEAIEGEGNIKVITHILKNKYYIEIIDNGMGMDEYTLGKVKEMFFTTKKCGSGLGVSLSNEIIKAHNGSIDYFSKLGNGTRVVVKLPIIVL